MLRAYPRQSPPYGGRSANYDMSLDGQRFLMVRRKSLPKPTTIHQSNRLEQAARMGRANPALEPWRGPYGGAPLVMGSR